MPKTVKIIKKLLTGIYIYAIMDNALLCRLMLNTLAKENYRKRRGKRQWKKTDYVLRNLARTSE